jgi:hypothetical protein
MAMENNHEIRLENLVTESLSEINFSCPSAS